MKKVLQNKDISLQLEKLKKENESLKENIRRLKWILGIGDEAFQNNPKFINKIEYK